MNGGYRIEIITAQAHQAVAACLNRGDDADMVQWGGVAHADAASDHEITITDHDYTIDGNTMNYDGESSNDFGGWADGGNTVANSSPPITDKSIVGGKTSNSEDSSRNTITIENGTVTGHVFGGFSYDKDASDNQIIMNGGTIGFIRGGDTYTGNVRRNVIIVNGGTVGEIWGGIAYFVNSSGVTVESNKIILNGGTITGVVRAGGSWLGRVLNNSIDIYNTTGTLDLSSATLYGYDGTGSEHSGNTLNIYTKGITANNILNFNSLNFYIPANAQSGDVMLILTNSGGTDISGATVNAGVQGGSTLKTGDTIILITNANGLTTNGTTYGTLSDGVSLNYDMTIEKSGDNAIVARIGNTTDDTATEATSTDSTDSSSSSNASNSSTDSSGSSSSNRASNGSSGSSSRPSGKLLPQTTVIANSAVLPTLHLAGYMSDKLIDWLPSRSFDFDDADDTDLAEDTQTKGKGYEFFIGAGGGSFRNKSGNGSYINSTVRGFDAGFGRIINYDSGDLAFAPVFEYATGDYDSYLSDGTHGKGSTKYVAGGLIGRKTFKSGFYIEASARGGKTERDFSSSTMTSGGSPVFVHYSKTSAPIFNGHLRIGRQLRLNRNNLLDVYGIYFHSHQGSMNLSLSTGEDYHFDSARSSKARIGYRLTTRTSKISRIYTGLAFQYEHTSEAVGTYKGRRTPGSSDHGASGMLEFGWLIKPNKNNSWMLDLNATGFVGHQRGLSGTIKLQKEF